jgi:predicted DsbA family dithiol-disulfide isomerase
MPVVLRLYSDLVCPFCFVAERSSLPRLLEDFDLALDWVGYELHPETPTGGVPLAEVFPNAAAMLRSVQAFAGRFGIPDLQPPERLVPTRRILAVAEHARAAGRLDAFLALAFDAHWRRGWGIETDEDLRWIAREAGLAPEEAVAAAADPALHRKVAAAREQALAAGVTSIPTFEFRQDAEAVGAGAPPSPLRIVGCQPYPVLAEAAARAGATRVR